MKSFRKLLIFNILLLLCITALSACTQDQNIPDTVDQGNAETADTQEAESSDDTETDADEETFAMKMRINDTEVNVSWEKMLPQKR
jgi:hypothetical protein